MAHHIARTAQFKGVQALNQARANAFNISKRGLGVDVVRAGVLSHCVSVRLLDVLHAVEIYE